MYGFFTDLVFGFSPLTKSAITYNIWCMIHAMQYPSLDVVLVFSIFIGNSANCGPTPTLENTYQGWISTWQQKFNRDDDNLVTISTTLKMIARTVEMRVIMFVTQT